MALTADVHIEIGELDLSGVPTARRFAVAASFERELARLVELQGVPTEGSNVAVRESSRPPMRLDANPILVGQAIARAVYEGLS